MENDLVQERKKIQVGSAGSKAIILAEGDSATNERVALYLRLKHEEYVRQIILCDIYSSKIRCRKAY